MMIRLASLVAAYADDACYLGGVILVGIGVYRVEPVATWFYAGASCLLSAYLIAAAKRKAAR